MATKKSPTQCAGINRHEAGNARVLRERSSEPLAPSFALHTVRCAAKRKSNPRLGVLQTLNNPPLILFVSSPTHLLHLFPSAFSPPFASPKPTRLPSA